MRNKLKGMMFSLVGCLSLPAIAGLSPAAQQVKTAVEAQHLVNNPACINYVTTLSAEPGMDLVDIMEKHGGECPGDPQIQHRLFSVYVDQKTKQMLSDKDDPESGDLSLLSPTEEDCSKKTISWEVDNCFVRNKDKSEKLLNKEYLAAKKRIEQEYSYDITVQKDQLQNLLDTQRSWLKYRAGQCKMEASLADEDSSAHLGLHSWCIDKLNQQRIAQFKEMPYG